MKLPPRQGRVVHSQPETVCSLTCGLLDQLDAWSGLGSRETASSGRAGSSNIPIRVGMQNRLEQALGRSYKCELCLALGCH